MSAPSWGVALAVLVPMARQVFARRRERADLAPVEPARVGVGPRRRRSSRRRARREGAQLVAELPRLAEAVARDVRAGMTVTDALVGARTLVGGPLAADLTQLDRALGAGASLADALVAWRDARTTPALDQFVAAVLLGAELGSRAAPAFEAVAAALRDQAEVADEVRALTTQSRASATLLTGLPPLACTGLAVIEPATAGFLFRSSAGLACVGTAAALVAAGWWWMDRLYRAER